MYKRLFSFLLLLVLAGCAGTGRFGDDISQPEPDEPVVDVFLYADEADLRRLYSRNPRSDQRIDGFVRFEPRGRIHGLRGGFRFRGNTSRYHPKKSFNIRFSRPQEILFGGYHLNLNAMYTDPSAIRERLGWEMFHYLGQPASKTRYVALYINDSYEGLGIHIQRVDELLLAQNGLDPNGTLIRDMTRRNNEALGLERQSIFGHDLSAEPDKAAFLAGVFNSRWNPEYTHVAELIQWVYDTEAGADFETGFTQRFDVENFMDWLALHYIMGDVDAFGDDYWLYRGRQSDSKWKILPWDNDLSFGKNERDGLTINRELGRYGRGLVQLSDFFAYEYEIDDAGWDNDLISKFLATPSLEQKLHDRMNYLMENVFTKSWFEDRIRRQKSVVEPFMTNPPEPKFRFNERQHHGLISKYEYHVENVMDFINLRYAFLDRRLNPVDGFAYYASANIENTGKIFLTDAEGWTIAWMEVSEFTGNPAISIESTSVDDVKNGISRRWVVHIDGGHVEGSLSLFYRNDIAPDGKENWYHQPEAIGNQWDLKIFKDGTALETTVNPYSNKVTAQVRLDGNAMFMVLE